MATSVVCDNAAALGFELQNKKKAVWEFTDRWGERQKLRE